MKKRLQDIFGIPHGLVTSAERLLLIAIVTAQESSHNITSQSKLAAMMGYTETSAIRKLLIALRRRGIVEIVGQGGRGRESNRYALHIPSSGGLAKLERFSKHFGPSGEQWNRTKTIQ